MVSICLILLSLCCILLGVCIIRLQDRVAKLEEQQKVQDATDRMIIKHLNQLLVDVNMLVEEHNNV